MVALRRTHDGPVGETGKGRRGGGKRNSSKGRGAKGKKSPVGKPSQQTKAKLRSTEALVKRSSLGFEDAAEEVIQRTAAAKKAPDSKFASRTVRGIRVPKLPIVPEIKQLRKD